MTKPELGSSGLYPFIKSFHIENLGCAKNQVDAEVMEEMLHREGWKGVPPDEASVILVNTCCFIEPAKEESIQTFLDLRKRFPGRKIIITGCCAQRYGAALLDMLPEADGVYGNAAPGRIVDFLTKHLKDEPMCYLPERELFFPFRRNTINFPGSVYIKISEGCSNNCTYCAIPLIRGTLVSREIDDIVEEVEAFREKGIYEFNFIGQDLASFGIDRGAGELEKLLRKLSDLPGEFWIRLLYMHPDHFPLDILSICNDDERILSYFDIPFQHASSKVLRRMGRRGDAEEYLDLIGTIRDSVSSAVIRSTFLTGFPGETGEDFRTLLDFQQRAKLDWAGVFTYSREEGTPAYRYRGALGTRLARRTMIKRKLILEQNQMEITMSRLDRFVGRHFDVLVEENITGEELSLGRMYAQAPEVDGLVVLRSSRVVPGTVVKAKIRKRNGLDLEAEGPQ